jgi:hypothetical protein
VTGRDVSNERGDDFPSWQFDELLANRRVRALRLAPDRNEGKGQRRSHTWIVRNRNTNKMMKSLLAFAALALFAQLAAAGTRPDAAVPLRYPAVRLAFVLLQSFPIHSFLFSSISSLFVILVLHRGRSKDDQDSRINH